MDNKVFFGILTDFGFDFAVASIKGVLLRAFPDAQVIDIDHTIEKFNVLNAAYTIDKVYRFFPNNMIFICVVDPGVGSKREALCVEIDSYTFIGPNNGIFHYILSNKGAKAYIIDEKLFNVHSITFHGRDLFSPAAIKIAQGDRSFLQKIDLSDLVRLDIDEHVITYIDSFGNIKTNISIDTNINPGQDIQFMINNKLYQIKFLRTFDDVQQGELLCYEGSNNTLEIAVNLGSAKKRLGVEIGTKIEKLSVLVSPQNRHI